MREPKAKRAVVTGAGSARGIGRASATELVRQGWRVAVLDRDETGAKETAQQLVALGNPVECAVCCDVGSEESVTEAMAAARSELGGIDALVNVAGITQPTTVLTTSAADWERVFRVNSLGVFLSTRAVLTEMLDRGHGRIVNISSVSAKRGGGVFGGPHYSASKAAVLGFTRAVARECGACGVTCNAVTPGLIDTDITGPEMTEQRRTELTAQIPAARLGQPDEVAALIAFLCSDAAGYITGEVIDINGGSHID
jgi:2-hydroxycyclohexanecarboxyl-CoA dehydrogenase